MKLQTSYTLNSTIPVFDSLSEAFSAVTFLFGALITMTRSGCLSAIYASRPLFASRVDK